MILPKVGVIIGVANINTGFVAIMASIQHQEAKIRQFIMIIDVKTLLTARRNAQSSRFGNFGVNNNNDDDRRTNQLLYPLRLRAG